MAEQLECSLFVSLSQKPPIRGEDNFSLIIIIIKSLNYYFMVFTNYMHKPEGLNSTMNWRESTKHNHGLVAWVQEGDRGRGVEEKMQNKIIIFKCFFLSPM